MLLIYICLIIHFYFSVVKIFLYHDFCDDLIFVYFYCSFLCCVRGGGFRRVDRLSVWCFSFSLLESGKSFVIFQLGKCVIVALFDYGMLLKQVKVLLAFNICVKFAVDEYEAIEIALKLRNFVLANKRQIFLSVNNSAKMVKFPEILFFNTTLDAIFKILNLYFCLNFTFILWDLLVNNIQRK